jgi:hypothetical protein
MAIRDHFTQNQLHSSMEEWTRFENVIKTSCSADSNVVISAEFMAALNKTAIMELQHLLACYNTTVIAFHRSTYSYMRSVWSQESKYRSPRSFYDFAALWILGKIEAPLKVII